MTTNRFEWQWGRARNAATALCAVAFLGCGGNQGVVVASYPTYSDTDSSTMEAGGLLSPIDSPAEPANRYWSTDTYLEPLDVARLWDTSKLDFVLITAKARL